MFFVKADVNKGEALGAVLSRFGIEPAQQKEVLFHQHNAHLRAGTDVPRDVVPDVLLRMMLTMGVVQPVSVVVPIDIKLTATEFQPVVDLKNGLRPRNLFTDKGPPTLTHGVNVRIRHNLSAGKALNWIQTVRKLNNPDRSAPLEFVDVGHNNLPFSEQPSEKDPPVSVEMSDTPVGPVASRPGTGVDFTAMTTLAVMARGHIILAAGMMWQFAIGTMQQGVIVKLRPRDATEADFKNQLRILRQGMNQFRDPTGAKLDYVLPPAPNSVVE